ncbi:sulfurtransferase TusA family protein [Chenggangzhangella methanolivorans]|uniref:Sulfurtransferase TusA family protein n=1 Tax=Chenggangzhangella methanolivorans TaxID=1437009 RepID=A0A9E6RCW4_9HYPH|nr:sulfurtransferase TusA family protein [Chenggangzhangella methanolivorans]QZO02528.1 sulfurtransferase TusA family protein [Chenggangzhangella methanolivorans]
MVTAEALGGAVARALDLRGLHCPLPVLKIRKALAGLGPGLELVAVTDDPLAAVDVPNFVRESGDALVDVRREGAARVFRIRKRESSA